MSIKQINLSTITTDAGTQIRVNVDEERVKTFTELMEEGVEFDPVVVFYDNKKFYLADGFHRFFASRRAGLPDIQADVRIGSLRDAQLFAIEANSKHGLPLSVADKRKSVMIMLADDEWNMWSDREIGRICNCSHTWVARVRKGMNAPAEPAKPAVAAAPKPAAEPAPKKEETPEQVAATKEFDEFVSELEARNSELEKLLALKALPENEQESAAALIDELREENNLLRVELEAVRKSRDTFQAENAQLKKQVAMYAKKLKQLEQ